MDDVALAYLSRISTDLFMRAINEQVRNRVAEHKERFPDPEVPAPQRLNRKQRRAARAKERR